MSKKRITLATLFVALGMYSTANATVYVERMDNRQVTELVEILQQDVSPAEFSVAATIRARSLSKDNQKAK